jgi:hypothetical protein
MKEVKEAALVNLYNCDCIHGPLKRAVRPRLLIYYATLYISSLITPNGSRVVQRPPLDPTTLYHISFNKLCMQSLAKCCWAALDKNSRRLERCDLRVRASFAAADNGTYVRL